MDEHKHLHHLKLWSLVSVVCSTDVCRTVHTYAATRPEKDPSHHGDVCAISTWIQVWTHEPEESSKGQSTDQIVPVDQTLASLALPPAIMQVLHLFQPFLPCIAAITQQQAILVVTSATHLTEGWIILSIITLSFRVLNGNLNKRNSHFMQSVQNFKIHCHINSTCSKI